MRLSTLLGAAALAGLAFCTAPASAQSAQSTPILLAQADGDAMPGRPMRHMMHRDRMMHRDHMMMRHRMRMMHHRRMMMHHRRMMNRM